MENVLFRKRIRKKGGLGRQVWPDRFSYSPWFRRSAQVSVELAQHRGIGGHADGLSARLARQPGNRGPIEFPASISSRVLNQKTIELAQRKLRAHVAITEAPLKFQERMQLPGSWTLEVVGHRGTGRATARRRSNATRTYTEVEDELRWPSMSLTTLA